MLMEMERLNMQLKEEQNRVLTLQNELKFGTANNRKLIEVCINIGVHSEFHQTHSQCI